MAAIPQPQPIPDADTLPFWEGCQQHRLLIPHCQGCGNFVFFPAPRCPQCGSAKLEWTPVSGRGRVYSWVVVHRPIHPAFTQVPYIVAVVELEEQEGLRLPGNLRGCPPEAVRAGMPVEVFFEPVSAGVTLPLWRPQEEEK